MKKPGCLRIVSVWVFLFLISAVSHAQNINTFDNFPDPQFRAAAEQFMGVLPGGQFTAAAANAKTGTFNGSGFGVSNLKGLNFFPNLTGLNLSNNTISNASPIDLLPSIITLNLSDNQLAEIDLTQNSALKNINLGTNQLSAIGGLGNLGLLDLRSLHIENNQMADIDLSNQLLLEDLNVKDNQFSELNLAANVNLIALNAAGNNLSALDLNTNLELRELNIANNQFTSFGPNSNLQLPNDPLNFQLEVLNISGNSLTSIPAAEFGRLTFLLMLDVSGNNITTMNISPLVNLESLNASNNNKDPNNGFHSINTSSNVNLTALNLADNAISRVDLSAVSGVTFTNNTNLVSLDLSGNLIGDATITSVTLIQNMLRAIDPGAPSVNDTLQILNLSRNRIDGITFANRAMRELNLSYNTLQILSVTGYTALETLNVASNPILFASKSMPGSSLNTVETATFPLDLRSIAGPTGTLRTVNISNTGALFFYLNGDNPYDSLTLDLGSGSPNPRADEFLNVFGHQMVVLPADSSLTTVIAASNEIYSVSGRINPTLLASGSLAGSALVTNGSLAMSILNQTDVMNGDINLDFRRNRFQVADESNELATVTAFIGTPNFQITGELINGFAYTPRANPSDQAGLLFTNEQDVLNTEGIVVLQPNGGEQYETPQNDVPLYYAVNAVAGAANNNVRIEVSYDGGATFSTIQAIETPASTGKGLEMTTGKWNIPANQNTSQGLIRVSRVDDPTIVDVSDNFFTVGRGSSISQVFTGVTMSFDGILFADPLSTDPQVIIAIELSDPTGLIGYQLRIAYDPNRFFFETGSVDKSFGVTEPFSDPFVNSDNQAGLLRIASTSITPVAAGFGQSEIVRFSLNAFSFAEVGTSPVEIVNAGTLLNDGRIEFVAERGTLVLVDIFVWGDLTGDNVAGVLDAANILRWAVGLITEFPGYPGIVAPAFPQAANVFPDTVLGTLDASAILSFVADPVANPLPADLDENGLGPDPILSKTTTSPKETLLYITHTDSDTLKFSVDDGEGVLGYIIALRYDPNELEVNLDAITSLLPNAVVIFNHIKPDELMIAGAVFPALANGPVDLMALDIEAKTENAVLTVDLARSSINDGEIILKDREPKHIPISAATTVPSWMLF